MDISKIEQFVNEEGKKISVVTNTSTDKKTFIGYMVVSHKAMGVSIPIDFHIEAQNIKQAFKRFEDAAMAEIEKAKASMNKPQIVTPGNHGLEIVGR